MGSRSEDSMVLVPITDHDHHILDVFKQRPSSLNGVWKWHAEVYDSLFWSEGQSAQQITMIEQVYLDLFKLCAPYPLDLDYIPCPQQVWGTNVCGIAVCLSAMRVVFGGTKDYGPIFRPEFQPGTYWFTGGLIVAILCRSAVDPTKQHLVAPRDKIISRIKMGLIVGVSPAKWGQIPGFASLEVFVTAPPFDLERFGRDFQDRLRSHVDRDIAYITNSYFAMQKLFEFLTDFQLLALKLEEPEFRPELEQTYLNCLNQLEVNPDHSQEVQDRIREAVKGRRWHDRDIVGSVSRNIGEARQILFDTADHRGSYLQRATIIRRNWLVAFHGANRPREGLQAKDDRGIIDLT